MRIYRNGAFVIIKDPSGFDFLATIPCEKFDFQYTDGKFMIPYDTGIHNGTSGPGGLGLTDENDTPFANDEELFEYLITLRTNAGGINETSISNAITAHEAETDPHTQYAKQDDLLGHTQNMANPHNTTKAQVGLSNVDNTSDANKPVSAPQQAVFDAKADLVAGKVPAIQLPSFVDDVLEYANLAALPVTGESGIIYVTIDTNKSYRWSGSAYVEISASPGSTDSMVEGVSNLYFTESRVRNTPITGVSFLDAVINAGDTILAALGKLQGQISNKVSSARQFIAGYGLSGGGDMSADRTFAVSLTCPSVNQEAVVTTTTSYVAISGFSLSLTPGTYRVEFSGNAEANALQSLGRCAFFVNGNEQSGSGVKRRFGADASGVASTDENYVSIHMFFANLSIVANTTIDVRFKHSVGGFNITDRTLSALRLA